MDAAGVIVGTYFFCVSFIHSSIAIAIFLQEWKNKPFVVVGFLRLGRTACEALKQYPEIVKYWAYHTMMWVRRGSIHFALIR